MANKGNYNYETSYNDYNSSNDNKNNEVNTNNEDNDYDDEDEIILRTNKAHYNTKIKLGFFIFCLFFLFK